RCISFKVINSPTILLPSWCKAVAGSAFHNRTLPRDVSTCWNSTYNMLAAFIKMKEYVDIFLDSSSNGLTQYLLTYGYRMESCQRFGICSLKDATEFFSLNLPNISAVIPAMDQLDENFAVGILDNHILSAPLRHAVSIGKQTINKYYELSDSSDIYQISMVLHPSYKTTYFT
ncbi:hypothetical protein BT96DRAFT_833638, partial [Gymnopus androsaceus JB14]